GGPALDARLRPLLRGTAEHGTRAPGDRLGPAAGGGGGDGAADAVARAAGPLRQLGPAERVPPLLRAGGGVRPPGGVALLLPLHVLRRAAGRPAGRRRLPVRLPVPPAVVLGRL